MAVTNITAGQKNWLSVLNNDLSQIGDKVASTSYPVTFVNGYSGDVKCRYWKLGSTALTVVTGYIKAPGAIPANKDLEFATLPKDGPTHLQSSYIYAPRVNVIANVSVSVDSSGTIHLRFLTPEAIYDGANLVLTAIEVW